MTEHALMKCGHVAQAVDGDGKPACVICVGMADGAREVAEAPPDLSGRTAKCCYRSCRSTAPSSLELPFFEHRPERERDEYYCGCWGWN